MNQNITNENLRKPMDFDALERTIKSLDENTRKLNEMIKEEGLSDPNVERLNELISDEEYCKKLFELESAEEVQRVLAQDGAELPIEYIDALSEHIFYLAEHLLKNGGELNEDELESVAGGVDPIITAQAAIGKAIMAHVPEFYVSFGSATSSSSGATVSSLLGGLSSSGGSSLGCGVAGLSTGACIGIAVGVVVAAALLIYSAVRQRW